MRVNAFVVMCLRPRRMRAMAHTRNQPSEEVAVKGRKKKVVARHRWVPDPHKRHGVVASKKVYDRKKAPSGRREPSSFQGRPQMLDGEHGMSSAR